MANAGVRIATVTGLKVSILVVAVLLIGCAATKPARDVPASGFLGEYRSLLRPGKEGEEAALTYRNPKANWAAYHKILLEPMTIWEDPASKLSGDKREDLQRLLDSFHHMLAQKLSKDYAMVATPAADTMHIQAAIIHPDTAVTELTVVSKVIPQARAANMLWTFASGKPAFAGEATIEFIVKDAQTGDLLAAGADRRVGGTNLFDKEVFNSWGDVKNALDFWADASVYRLCVLRGGTNCVKPKE